MKTLTALLLYTSITMAQQAHNMQLIKSDQTPAMTSKAYEIPFLSKGNIIELTVANISNLTAEGVKVAVTKTPEWIKFESNIDTLQQVKANEEQTAVFSFSVDKNAEVNKEQILTFNITERNGQMWTKEIKIKVSPPTNYELFQNYPNPFNPTTIISYQLSSDSKVTLKIYDVLGKEVANLIDEQEEAGYHQTTFDAHKFASGMYIYRLSATEGQNKHHIFQKKMLVLK